MTTLAAATHKPRILCLDDSIMVTHRMAMILAKEGFDTVPLNDPQECLTMLRRSRWNLVIVDIRMPKISGLDLIQKIREIPEGRNLPVLVVTAAFSADAIRTGKALGVSGWLVKPFEATSLIKAVKKALQSKTLPSSPSKTEEINERLEE